GYRFPAVGASDFPACRFMSDCRTYAWAEGAHDKTEQSKDKNSKPAAAMPAFVDWLRAVADGKSFVTTGPLLLLEVDGSRPGEVLRFAGAEPRTLTARVRVRSEVTPVKTIDLIVNGEVVKRFEGVHQGDWGEVSHRLTLNESSWIAARAWSTTFGGQPDAESHTNAVHVHLNGKAPYRQKSLDTW